MEWPDRFIGLLEPIKFPHTAKNGNDFGNVMQQIMVDACVVAGGKSYGTYRLDNIPRSIGRRCSSLRQIVCSPLRSQGHDICIGRCMIRSILLTVSLLLLAGCGGCDETNAQRCQNDCEMHCGFDHAPFKTQQACVDSCVQEQCSYYPTYVVGPDTG